MEGSLSKLGGKIDRAERCGGGKLKNDGGKVSYFRGKVNRGDTKVSYYGGKSCHGGGNILW